MQFNGIGSGHDQEMHHITNCMHEHAHYKKQEGATGAGAGGMEAQAMEMMQKQEGELSLSGLTGCWETAGVSFVGSGTAAGTGRRGVTAERRTLPR